MAKLLNHSIDLASQEVEPQYSIILRTLIQECLFRESFSRPTSVQLVKRTRNGLDKVLEIAKEMFSETSVNEAIPFVALGGGDEPPTAWLVERLGGEYEIISDTPPSTGTSPSSPYSWAQAGITTLSSVSLKGLGTAFQKPLSWRKPRPQSLPNTRNLVEWDDIDDEDAMIP